MRCGMKSPASAPLLALEFLYLCRIACRRGRGASGALASSPYYDPPSLSERGSLCIGKAPSHLCTEEKIQFKQARAEAIYPDGLGESSQPLVDIERTADNRAGQREQIPYDYLVNAKGWAPVWGSSAVATYNVFWRCRSPASSR